MKYMQCKTPVYVQSESRGSGSYDIKSRHEIMVKNGVKRLTVPCGKCYSCLSNRRNSWTFRIQKEAKVSTSAWFLTLTYSDDNLPIMDIKQKTVQEASKLISQADNKELERVLDYRPTLVKADYQNFMKKIRNRSDAWWKDCGDLAERYGIERKPIKYYAVGEYGGNTKRPHYHAIIFNVPLAVIEKLDQTWNKGFVQVGTVKQASIHYVTKYCINPEHKQDNIQDEFTLISKGIGVSYLDDNTKWHKQNQAHYVINKSGGKQQIPRYYEDKIFTKLEKAVNGHSNMLEGDKRFKEETEKAIKQGDKYEDKFKQMVQDELRKLNQIREKKQKL